MNDTNDHPDTSDRIPAPEQDKPREIPEHILKQMHEQARINAELSAIGAGIHESMKWARIRP